MSLDSNNIDLNENDDKNPAQNSRDNIRKVAWICTAIAVCVGILVTKKPDCLWALALPLFL